MLSVAFSTLQSVNKMQAAVSTSKSAKLFFSTKILKKKIFLSFYLFFRFWLLQFVALIAHAFFQHTHRSTRTCWWRRKKL